MSLFFHALSSAIPAHLTVARRMFEVWAFIITLPSLLTGRFVFFLTPRTVLTFLLLIIEHR
jgi:hypothetical protein